MTQTNRRTALHDEHVALNGRIVPFAGFDMPVQYAGILREHDAVRHRAGLFDLSHMAQFELEGDDVGAWADALTVNNVASMKPWQARYNLFCNEAGGTHDDVLFYRLGDGGRWLLVANASNADKIWALISERAAGTGVKLTNRHGERALIAVQGPKAVDIVGALSDDATRERLRAMKYYTCAEETIDGVAALVARTGYTGEDGFELFVDGADAPGLWRRLLETGAGAGLEPCGLGARDVLRLEAGMPLYGHELTETITPLAGGQQWAVKLAKPAFVGKEALAAQAAADEYARVAGVVLSGRVPARDGYAVFAGDEPVGEVRSASIAPSVGNRNIATVLVRKDAAAVGTVLGVEIRGTKHEATVVPLPFYKRPQ
jgi:aminomethyltransferase